MRRRHGCILQNYIQFIPNLTRREVTRNNSSKNNNNQNHIPLAFGHRNNRRLIGRWRHQTFNYDREGQAKTNFRSQDKNRAKSVYGRSVRWGAFDELNPLTHNDGRRSIAIRNYINNCRIIGATEFDTSAVSCWRWDASVGYWNLLCAAERTHWCHAMTRKSHQFRDVFSQSSMPTLLVFIRENKNKAYAQHC